MKRSVRHYATALAAAIEAGGKPADLAQQLRLLLRKDRATRLMPRVLRMTTELLQSADGRRAVTVETARAQNAPELSHALKTALHSDVDVETHIEPSLKGGAVLRAGDTRVDGSVAHMLTTLRKTLLGTATSLSESVNNKR